VTKALDSGTREGTGEIMLLSAWLPDRPEERLMTTTGRRFPSVFPALAGVTVLVLGSSPALVNAEFGFGVFGGFNYVPSPTNLMHSRDLISAGRGIQARPSHSPLSGNPNAYFNRVRDNGFVPRYDVTRRVPSTSSAPLPSSLLSPRPAQPAPAPAPKPVLPLASFFDASMRLVWPNDAPVNGELKEKRDESDQASLAALGEKQRLGAATITVVTYARQKLLDYGRPALQEIRTSGTPRLADTFHLFLLSLYESLAQAATPPAASSDPAPKP
jgi:hypothetical protein